MCMLILYLGNKHFILREKIFSQKGLSLRLPLSFTFVPLLQTIHNTFSLSTFPWAWSDEATTLPVYSVVNRMLLLTSLWKSGICTVRFSFLFVWINLFITLKYEQRDCGIDPIVPCYWIKFTIRKKTPQNIAFGGALMFSPPAFGPSDI